MEPNKLYRIESLTTSPFGKEKNKIKGILTEEEKKIVDLLSEIVVAQTFKKIRIQDNNKIQSDK